MAFTDFLVERVHKYIPDSRKLEMKKMMGGLIFMVNDKMCVGVDIDKKSGDDRLMVRVGKLAYNHLLELPGCREMDFTGRTMKGFLFIYPEGFDTEKDLQFWVQKALDFNDLLQNS